MCKLQKTEVSVLFSFGSLGSRKASCQSTRTLRQPDKQAVIGKDRIFKIKGQTFLLSSIGEIIAPPPVGKDSCAYCYKKSGFPKLRIPLL